MSVVYQGKAQICMLRCAGLTRVRLVDEGLTMMAWDVRSKPRVYRVRESWLVKASRRCRCRGEAVELRVVLHEERLGRY